MSDSRPEDPGGTTTNSRYSVKTKVGYRRKEQGEMDPHLIMNWTSPPPRPLLPLSAKILKKNNSHATKTRECMQNLQAGKAKAFTSMWM